MERTRIQLMLDYPFFGSLALTLDLVPDESIETASTNGKIIRYNPTFVNVLTNSQKMFLYIHEICHIILGHSVRRGDRNPTTWNIAADYAVNLLIHESTDLIRPPGVLFKREYSKWSTEKIYEELADEYREAIEHADSDSTDEAETTAEQENREAYQSMAESSEQWGQVEDSRPEDDVTEGDIKSSAALITSLLTAAGTPPSTRIREIVETFTETKTRWQDLLSKFMHESCDHKYNWLKPNRRYRGHGGIILPSMVTSESMVLAVAIDTSGSIGRESLSEFMKEFQVLIRSINYNKIIVLGCSDVVHSPQIFLKGEEIKYTLQGHPQTAFVPVFEYLASIDEQPACLIYFTDLFSDSFGNSPDFPVLWIGNYSESWEKSHRGRIPFGEIINIK